MSLATSFTAFRARVNTDRHELALRLYTVLVLAHWSEHLVQAVQVYVLGWPLPEARGLLGIPFPWLVKTEVMHYLYALFMLVGFWLLRPGFVGRSHKWWTIALCIQFWHHIEHVLLQGQVIFGANFFGAPAPISVIQMVGFFFGTAVSGFDGLMMGPPVRPMSLAMLLVRRVEVHMIYNTIVFVPMVIAMYYHLLPTAAEHALMRCSCAIGRDVKRATDAPAADRAAAAQTAAVGAVDTRKSA